MPILISRYMAPPGLGNPHCNTFWPVLFRHTPPFSLDLQRIRIETSDADFLDVDIHPCATASPHGIAVLSHGLEGNSRRKYILGLAHMLSAHGFIVMAWNMRSCSGEMNRTPYLYHMGETGDLATVIAHATSMGLPVFLAGFSMGGNQICRYLAREKVSPLVKAAAAISVPCDLAGSAPIIDKALGGFYTRYFLRSMRHKVRDKAARFAGYPSLEGLERMSTFAEFDERFTAPIYGFASAQDYWQRNSTSEDLFAVRVPLYFLQSADDPFCSAACYPVEAARKNENLHLEITPHGGHVGFVQTGPLYYTEQRVLEFLREVWPGFGV